MSSNIEIKARVEDSFRFRQAAERLSQTRETILQEDTFFDSPRGRLKLRCFPDGSGELIYYERTDQPGPKQSQYWISKTRDSQSLRFLLSQALGIVGVVRKTRQLFLVGQTRIHLDEVEGLGTFAELEVVMQPGQTLDEGKSIATDLMWRLGIRQEELVDGSYIDLARRRATDPINGTDS